MDRARSAPFRKTQSHISRTRCFLSTDASPCKTGSVIAASHGDGTEGPNCAELRAVDINFANAQTLGASIIPVDTVRQLSVVLFILFWLPAAARLRLRRLRRPEATPRKRYAGVRKSLRLPFANH